MLSRKVQSLCVTSETLSSVAHHGALQHALRDLLQHIMSEITITMPCQQHTILPISFSVVVELLRLPSETDQMKLSGVTSPLNRIACRG